MANYTPIEEKVMQARVRLLLTQPFFGMLALKLQLKEVDSETAQKMPTVACDGRYFWFNPEFIEKLTQEQLMFVISHEIMHQILHHAQRRNNRDPKLWGVSNDHLINTELVMHGLTMPPVGEYNEEFANWTSEDVYDKLKDEDENGGSNSQTPTMDVHPGEDGFPGQDPADMDDLEQEQMAQDWSDAMQQAAQAAGAGKVPGMIKRLIQDLSEPKMDWRQILLLHLQSCVKSDYSWTVPNKRTFAGGITMPSMTFDDTIEIAISIDCSGSVSPQMLRDFLSEVRGICEAFSGYKIHIACFDTQVYHTATLENEEDMEDYINRLEGGGGTDFMCWWNWAVEQDWIGDIHKILFFTDGLPFAEWGIDGVCDTLWIVHGSTNEAPFGTTVFYEDHLDR